MFSYFNAIKYEDKYSMPYFLKKISKQHNLNNEPCFSPVACKQTGSVKWCDTDIK